MDVSLSPYAQTSVSLFGGVAAVLLLASAVGATLKRTVAQGRPHPVIDNLNARVNAWWVMVGAIGAAFVFGAAGVVLLFALVSICALRGAVKSGARNSSRRCSCARLMRRLLRKHTAIQPEAVNRCSTLLRK